jgi:hypothetical protein
VADYGNDPNWRAAVTQMRPLTPGPAQAGVTTHDTLGLLGRTSAPTPPSTGRARTPAPMASPRPENSCKALASHSQPARTPSASTKWSRVACLGPYGHSSRWWPGCSSGQTTADLRRLKRMLEATVISGSATEETAN